MRWLQEGRRRVGVMAALSVLLALGVLLGGSMRLDRVAVVVDKDVITETELMAQIRVALALRYGPSAASADLQGPLLESLRDHVINETLVGLQARRLGAIEISEDKVQQQLWQLQQRFGSVRHFEDFLKKFGMEVSWVQSILRRHLRNEAYVAQRLHGLQLKPLARPPSAAVKAWLDELRYGVDVRVLGPDGTLVVYRPPTGAP